MKIKIIRIGSSFGIRSPKTLLKQYGFEDTAILKVENGQLILSPDQNPRARWHEGFKKMPEIGDDVLVDIDDIKSNFDEEEWEWYRPADSL